MSDDTTLLEDLRLSLGGIKLEAEWTCEAVGEVHHQDALLASVQARQHAIRTEIHVERAELVHEPDNEHDRDAIRVEVDGRKVGHIPRSVPKVYRAALLILLDRGVRLFATGRIVGRAENETGARYEVCVELPEAETLIELLAETK